ncbi:MAG: PEP-CTERM sorting domain-containing protein [Proteobacteria bacterium]|nr:PEP-CTERM sorting domain-containing protein [Pseudomonadota bacterium]
MIRLILSTIFVCMLSSGQAIGIPIDAESFVHTFARAGNAGSKVMTGPNEASASSSHVDTIPGTNAYAWASLSEASLKGSANNTTNTTRPSVSRATLFDFLKFSSSSDTVDISFELGFDGRLSRLTHERYNSDSYASASTTVSIYDVTDIDHAIDNDFFNPEISLEVRLAALYDPNRYLTPSHPGFYGLLDDDVSWALSSTPFYLQTVFNDTSPIIDIDFSEIVEITVPTDRLLIFRMTQNLVTSNGRADFLGTSSFEFTDLGGSTFSSLSGVFPGSTTSTVPEPSTLTLFALGGLFTFFRRKLFA